MMAGGTMIITIGNTTMAVSTMAVSTMAVSTMAVSSVIELKNILMCIILHIIYYTSHCAKNFYLSIIRRIFNSIFLNFSLSSDQAKGSDANSDRLKITAESKNSGPASMSPIILGGMIGAVGVIFVAAALYLGRWT